MHCLLMLKFKISALLVVLHFAFIQLSIFGFVPHDPAVSKNAQHWSIEYNSQESVFTLSLP